MLPQRITKPFQIALTSIFLFALSFSGFMQPLLNQPVVHAAGKPPTIPAMREWTDGAGSFTYSAASRIMYNGAGLAGDAATFAADLQNMTGFNIATVSGSSPAAGDIYMTLGDSDTTIGTEGYKLTIGSSVTISARANAGAFYGTRTMLQLIKQNFTIAGGTARDWPLYPQRGTHVDNGRKYFTLAWLRDHVREAAYLKMNIYHLHMSDRQGWRLELFSHPEVPTAPYITQAELANLIALANQYHVTIVPEFDSPGHLTAALRNHPELWKGGTDSTQLDVGIPASYTFMQEIFNEVIPLFPGPWWHIGADEYNLGSPAHYITYAQQNFCQGGTATYGDAVVGYVNWVNDIIKAHGKSAWAWHDVLRITNSCVSIDTDITIDFWNDDPTAEAIPGGYMLINSNRWKTYYVLGGASTGLSKILAWNPAIFAGATIAVQHPQNRGGKGLHIWCDKPENETQESIANSVYDLYRGAGQKTWDSPMHPTSFTTIIGLVGRSPFYGEHLGSPTPTPPAATATRTNTPSGPTNTPTRTNTPAPPTNTPTRTNTPSGPTNTPVPPTNTPTRTNTPIGPTATPGSGGNLALGKTVTVSSFNALATDGNPEAVDANLSTIWRTNKGSTLTAEWITVDLGSSQSISNVTLKWDPDFYATAYTIQISTDNANWTTKFTTTTGNSGTDVITFAASSARYVKMNATAWTHATERLRLQEIEVYQ